MKLISLVGGLLLVAVAGVPPASRVLSHAQERLDPEVSTSRMSMRTTGALVTPYMADAFADSFGVNTRFGQGIYGSQRPTVERFLTELGFRHIRDGGVVYDAGTRAFLRNLCTAHGIHSSLGLNDTDADAKILQYVNDVPCIDMVEGPNELNGQPNWQARLANFMPHAYNLIRSTPAFAGIPIVGPSITSIEDADKLGTIIDLSKYVDIGNKHSYPGQINIGGSDGTGDHGFGRSHEPCPQYSYGSFFYNVCLAQLFTKDRTIWATETGYSSTPNGLASPPQHPPYGSIPYDVAVKYFPRLMAYEFLNGISRTYIMALLDGSSGCNGQFNALGLIEQDCPNTGSASSLHPKPQYYALKNLMAAVVDPGPAFAPIPLNLRVAGGDGKLQTMLLQKRSGRYMLFYWVEGTNWNVNAGSVMNVNPEPIAVTVSGARDGDDAKNIGIDSRGNLTAPSPVRFAAGTARLTATDSLQFVTFDTGKPH